MKKNIYFGYYTACMDMDWGDTLAVVRQSGRFAGGIVKHLLTPWSGTSEAPHVFYPWNFNTASERFDLKSGKFNEKWFEKFHEFLLAHAKRRMRPAICVFDQYFNPKDMANAAKAGLPDHHPFLHNNLRVSLPDIGKDPIQTVRLIYNNGGTQHAQFWFNPKIESKPETYEPSSPFGAALFAFLDRLVFEYDSVYKAVGGMKLIIRSCNEEQGSVDASGHVQGGSALGDDSLLDNLIAYKFTKHGYKKGVDFIQSNDWWPHTLANTAWPNWEQSGRYIKQKSGLHEVHNIDFKGKVLGAADYLSKSKQKIQDFINHALKGATPARLWLSMDGGREAPTYFDLARYLWDVIESDNAGWGDIKYYVVRGWKPLDSQANFGRYFEDFLKNIWP